MGTIHKLTKGGATVFPATVTDAVVHPDTKAVVTTMINEYNLSVLYPTAGINNTRVYDLASAVAKLTAELSSDYKVLGVKAYFETGVAAEPVVCYNFVGTTFSNPAHWKKTKLSTEEMEAALDDHGYEIQSLIKGAKLTITATPSRVVNDTETTISVSASMSKITPATMTLYQNNVLISTVSNQDTITGSATGTYTTDQVFKVVATYHGGEFEETTTVISTGNATYGFATAVSDVITPITASTVKGRYTVQCPADNLFLFFVVPVDMDQPIGFRVGGVEAAMIKWEADLSQNVSGGSNNQESGGEGGSGEGEGGGGESTTTHWIYRTGAQYDQNTTLTIDVY